MNEHNRKMQSVSRLNRKKHPAQIVYIDADLPWTHRERGYDCAKDLVEQYGGFCTLEYLNDAFMMGKELIESSIGRRAIIQRGYNGTCPAFQFGDVGLISDIGNINMHMSNKGYNDVAKCRFWLTHTSAMCGMTPLAFLKEAGYSDSATNQVMRLVDKREVMLKGKR